MFLCVSQYAGWQKGWRGGAHRELEVARSICSSSCEEEANHPDIMVGASRCSVDGREMDG